MKPDPKVKAALKEEQVTLVNSVTKSDKKKKKSLNESAAATPVKTVVEKLKGEKSTPAKTPASTKKVPIRLILVLILLRVWVI